MSSRWCRCPLRDQRYGSIACMASQRHARREPLPRGPACGCSCHNAVAKSADELERLEAYNQLVLPLKDLAAAVDEYREAVRGRLTRQEAYLVLHAVQALRLVLGLLEEKSDEKKSTPQ